MSGDDPFHDGERAIHARFGMREKLADLGRKMLRDHMPDQHRAFFGQLPFLIVGSLDDRNMPWASIVTGAPGFVDSPDARRLHVASLPAEGDPLRAALVPGARLGLLGIEPATRRRNRLNGRVESAGADGFVVEVEQSFGNCPKYIQARDWRWRDGAPAPVSGRFETAASLDAADLSMIGAADTFFIATAYGTDDGGAAHGVDASHRGGKPGFVAALPDGRLMAPDYSGNFLFNTFGNIEKNPRAGLLFVDFADGRMLQISGAARILWDPTDAPALPDAARAGAQRFLEITPGQVVRADAAVPLSWSFGDYSPYLERL